MLNGLIMFLIFLLWWLPSLILGFSFTTYNILWFIIYFIITIGIFKVFLKHRINRNYLCLVLLNYLYHFSFRIFFVYYQNYFYSFILFLVSLLISTFWYHENQKIDKESSYYLLPYLFGSLSLLLLFIHR